MRKPNYTPLMWAIEAATLLILFFNIIYLAAIWPQVPELVANHYNFAGQADGWGGKATLWLMPGLSFLLYLGMTASLFAPDKYFHVPVKLTEQNREAVLAATHRMMCLLKLVIIALMAILSIAAARGASLPLPLMIISMVLLFGVLVYYFIDLFRISRRQK